MAIAFDPDDDGFEFEDEESDFGGDEFEFPGAESDFGGDESDFGDDESDFGGDESEFPGAESDFGDDESDFGDDSAMACGCFFQFLCQRKQRSSSCGEARSPASNQSLRERSSKQDAVGSS